jgi:hypothetical protein
MAISHKELLEQISRIKALREAADLTPMRANEAAPLALDTNEVRSRPILNNMVARVGVGSDKASQHQSLMLQNKANFQEYMQAQKAMEKAQQSLKRAEKMQQLQAQYNGGGGRRGRAGQTSSAPQWLVDQINQGKAPRGNFVASGSGSWKDPTPVNLGAGLRTFGTPYGNIKVNATAGDNFVNFLRALNRTGYKVTSLGSYANRNIAGTNTRSLHSYGLAIDINPAQNPVAYGKVITNLPKGIGRLAAKYGLAWGGNWNGSKKDPMHFSIPAYGTK